MDAGGTATTECPPNRGSEWKHESPDFSRGESQIPISYYLSAGVGIVIAIALILPLSKRLAIFFAAISAVSGIVGFAVMSWIFVTEGEANPVTAPLVGAIAFSALLYLRPRLR